MYIINKNNKIVKLTKNIKPRTNIDWNEANRVAKKQGFKLIGVKENLKQMHKSKAYQKFMTKYWTWNAEQLKKGQTIKDVTGLETNKTQWISEFKVVETESFGASWGGGGARPGVVVGSPLYRDDDGVAVCEKVGKIKKQPKLMNEEVIKTEVNKNMIRVLRKIADELESDLE